MVLLGKVDTCSVQLCCWSCRSRKRRWLRLRFGKLRHSDYVRLKLLTRIYGQRSRKKSPMGVLNMSPGLPYFRTNISQVGTMAIISLKPVARSLQTLEGSLPRKVYYTAILMMSGA
jgi:hypothetical protein